MVTVSYYFHVVLNTCQVQFHFLFLFTVESMISELFLLYTLLHYFILVQVKEEAQQLALIFETVGGFKVKRKGGKGKLIFGR